MSVHHSSEHLWGPAAWYVSNTDLFAIKSYFFPLSKLSGPSASNPSSLPDHLLPLTSRFSAPAGVRAPRTRKAPTGFLSHSEERSSPR